MLKFLIFSLFSFQLFINGCATNKVKNSDILKSEVNDKYIPLLEKYSDKVQIYSGLENVLEVHGTLLSSPVLESQLELNQASYQWNPEVLKTELTKTHENSSKYTEVFISLFTPEKIHDDLNKNKTLWKIFLDVNGKRYEGKATKVKLLTAEIQNTYPYHNKWLTPYVISFPVPTKEIDNQTAKLTLTGPIGSAQLSFPNK
jgi:hypothetical protein